MLMKDMKRSEILHNIKKIRMSGPETSKNKHFNSSVQQTRADKRISLLRYLYFVYRTRCQ